MNRSRLPSADTRCSIDNIEISPSFVRNVNAARSVNCSVKGADESVTPGSSKHVTAKSDEENNPMGKGSNKLAPEYINRTHSYASKDSTSSYIGTIASERALKPPVKKSDASVSSTGVAKRAPLNPSAPKRSSSITADKYGTTLESYESFSSHSINPRSESILAASRGYVAAKDRIGMNESVSWDEYESVADLGGSSISGGNALKKSNLCPENVVKRSESVDTEKSKSGKTISTIAPENYVGIIAECNSGSESNAGHIGTVDGCVSVRTSEATVSSYIGTVAGANPNVKNEKATDATVSSYIGTVAEKSVKASDASVRSHAGTVADTVASEATVSSYVGTVAGTASVKNAKASDATVSSYIGTVAGTVEGASNVRASDAKVSSYIGTVAGTVGGVQNIQASDATMSSFIGTVADTDATVISYARTSSGSDTSLKRSVKASDASVISYAETLAGTVGCAASVNASEATVSSYIGTVTGTASVKNAKASNATVNSYIGTVAGTVEGASNVRASDATVSSYIGTVAGTVGGVQNVQASDATMSSYIGTVADTDATVISSAGSSSGSDRSLKKSVKSLDASVTSYAETLAGTVGCAASVNASEATVSSYVGTVAGTASVKNEKASDATVSSYIGTVADTVEGASNVRASDATVSSYIGTVAGTVGGVQNVQASDATMSSYIGTVTGSDASVKNEKVSDGTVTCYVGTLTGTASVQNKKNFDVSVISHIGTLSVAERSLVSNEVDVSMDESLLNSKKDAPISISLGTVTYTQSNDKGRCFGNAENSKLDANQSETVASLSSYLGTVRTNTSSYIGANETYSSNDSFAKCSISSQKDHNTLAVKVQQSMGDSATGTVASLNDEAVTNQIASRSYTGTVRTSSSNYIGVVNSGNMLYATDVDVGKIHRQNSDASSVNLNSISPCKPSLIQEIKGRVEEAETASHPLTNIISSESTISTKNTWSKSSQVSATKDNSSATSSTRISTSSPDREAPPYNVSTSVLRDKYGTTVNSYASFSSHSLKPRSEEILIASRNYVQTREKCGITTADSMSDAETVTTLDRIIADFKPRDCAMELSDNYFSIATDNARRGSESQKPVCTSEFSVQDKSVNGVQKTGVIRNGTIKDEGGSQKPTISYAGTVRTSTSGCIGTANYSSTISNTVDQNSDASLGRTVSNEIDKVKPGQGKNSSSSYLGTVRTSSSSHIGTVDNTDSSITKNSAGNVSLTVGCADKEGNRSNAQNSMSGTSEVTTPIHANEFLSHKQTPETENANLSSVGTDKCTASVGDDNDAESSEDILGEPENAICTASKDEESSIKLGTSETLSSEQETIQHSKRSDVINRIAASTIGNPLSSPQEEESSLKPACDAIISSASYSGTVIGASSVKPSKPPASPHMFQESTQQAAKSTSGKNEAAFSAIKAGGSHLSTVSIASNDRYYGIDSKESDISTVYRSKPQTSPKIIIKQTGSHISAALAEKSSHASEDDNIPTLLSVETRSSRANTLESPSSHYSTMPPPLMTFDSKSSTSTSHDSSSTKSPPSPRMDTNLQYLRSNSTASLSKLSSKAAHRRNISVNVALNSSGSVVSSRALEQDAFSTDLGSNTTNLVKTSSFVDGVRPGSPRNRQIIEESRSRISDSFAHDTTSQDSAPTHNDLVVDSPVSIMSNGGNRFISSPQSPSASQAHVQNDVIIRESTSRVSTSLPEKTSFSTAPILMSSKSTASTNNQESKPLESISSIVCKVGDRYGIDAQRSGASPEAQVEDEVIIRASATHVSTSLADKASFESGNTMTTLMSSATTVSINNQESKESLASIRSETGSDSKSPRVSLSSQEIIKDLESHNVAKKSSPQVPPPPHSTAPHDLATPFITSQPLHPAPSPRNQQILNEFKNRVELLSSPRNKRPVKASVSSCFDDQVIKASIEKYESASIESNRSATFDIDDESFVESKDDTSSFISFNGLVSEADESILDTDFCRRFILAFEATLKSNPGILPGEPTVANSLEQMLSQLTREKADREYAMKGQLQKFKNEQYELENEINSRKDTTGENVDQLAEEVETLKKEKALAHDALKALLDDVQAVKRDVERKKDEALYEKDELAKRLNDLRTSHAEIKASLETETKLLQKERESLTRVADTRRSITAKKAENKELEISIEATTETLSKEKSALQAQTVELKACEEELLNLKQSNYEIQKELEDERKDLLELTLSLQQRKQALIESKVEIENNLKREKEEFQNRIERSSIMHTRQVKKMPKNKGGMNIDAMIKSQIATEMKKKLTQKNNKKNRQADLCIDSTENKGNNNSIETCTTEIKEGKLEERALLTADSVTGEIEIEAIVHSRVDAQLRQKESELKTISEEGSSYESSFYSGTSSMSTKEICNTTSRGELSVTSDDITISSSWFSVGASSSYDKYSDKYAKPDQLKRSSSFAPATLTSDKYACDENTTIG